MKKILCFLFLVIASSAFSWTLKTGTYELVGVNPYGNAYYGQVVIVPQGENYKVVWYLDSGQTQVGIGIHRDWEDVLSVAFADISTGYWGCVSYKANAWGDVEGRWTSSSGNVQGTETLRWISYSTY